MATTVVYERFGDFVFPIARPKHGFFDLSPDLKVKIFIAQLRLLECEAKETRQLWEFVTRFYDGYMFQGHLNEEKDFRDMGIFQVWSELSGSKVVTGIYDLQVLDMMFHAKCINPDLMERMMQQTIEWLIRN